MGDWIKQTESVLAENQYALLTIVNRTIVVGNSCGS